MVAVIHHTKGFHNVLNYNENKVAEQVAECLEAANYPKKVEELTFTQRLKRLENQAALNEKTTVNCVHISLNFDPTEQFSDDKLKEIAAVYMDKIGFGEQPYLLYRHDDSGHPHVHIVTTNIKETGKRIELHNLGKVQSEKARKEIDTTYGLLRPEDSKNRRKYELNPVNVQKALYGKGATKKAITTVLNKVVNDYKYSSLAELNAVLNQYNVAADRGSTESRIYQNHGLTYRILDADGNKIGVPIKASDFYNKLTLKVLEEKFTANEPLKQSYKSRIKNAVDLALLRQGKPNLVGLIQSLNKEGINMVVRQNTNGTIYGMTYVDHQTKCVFNGSDLGKQYSANAIQERCGIAGNQQPNAPSPSIGQAVDQQHDNNVFPHGASFTDALLQQTEPSEAMPFELKRNKKKRRKRL